MISRAFPASAPVGGSANASHKRQVQNKNNGDAKNTTNNNDEIRTSLARHNVEACKALLSITKRRIVSETYPGIGYSSRMWLASAITPPGIVLMPAKLATKWKRRTSGTQTLLCVAKDALLVQHEAKVDVSFEHLDLASRKYGIKRLAGAQPLSSNANKKNSGINVKEIGALKRKA